MTNFTSFAFRASGIPTVCPGANPCERTLPTRLVDIHNVKDYGAIGDGVHDDWAAIMACLQWSRYYVTAAASNRTAAFTGVVAQANFTGTLSGNSLTTSGVTGTVSIGHTISGSGITACKIVSGSGSSWTVDGSPQTASGAMSTNSILTVSSVTSGAINVNDFLINNGGTDASPSTLIAGTYIQSQQSSTVYILFWPFYYENGFLQNFTSQPMMTVSPLISLTSSISGAVNQCAFDVNNSTVVGDGISHSSTIQYPSAPNSIQLTTTVGGLVSPGDTFGIDENASRGIIFFPPGNYLVSKPIDFSASNIIVVFRGCLGASTITANFADYVFKQKGASQTFTAIESLNIVNTNASGGGIRYAASLPGAIRRCNITANRCINDYKDDGKPSGAYFGAFEVTFEDCILSPGANVTGSIGIAKTSDGPVTNCIFTGFETGFSCAGGEGCQVLLGNYFEKCGDAVLLGVGPDGGFDTSSGVVIAGCWFKNNTTAINIKRPSSLTTIAGNYIEGTNGQAPSGTDPQYGILNGVQTSGFLAQAMVAGVNVVGSYHVGGVYFNGRQYDTLNPILIGVADNSTSPNPFFIDPTGALYLPMQIGCSARHIATVAQLPPTSPDVGQELNVSDGTNGLAWGATVTNTGTHTTPYLVRWNGSAWAVIGK